MRNCLLPPGLPGITPACTGQSISPAPTSPACWNGRCPESQLMDSLNPESPPPPVVRAQRPPRIWKFWGTALWGLFIFAGLFVGQAAVIVYFLLRQQGPIDLAAL